MADPVVADVKAEVASVKSKVVAFVQAHYSKVVSAAVGFAAAKFGVLGFIWKVI